MLICSYLIFTYSKNNTKQNINQSPPIQTTQTSVPEISTTTLLEINDTKYETQINKPISVYDFMSQLQNEGKISFKEETYSGMGKFIEEINGIKNGDKYWIYYVNGKKANIGVSNYKINPGDIVSWKYENHY